MEMKWLEQIKLRGNNAELSEIKAELLEKVESLLDEPAIVEVQVFTHALLSGDLLVNLFWDSDQPQPWGSELGLRLAENLKRSGLIDHAVWLGVLMDQGVSRR